MTLWFEQGKLASIKRIEKWQKYWKKSWKGKNIKKKNIKEANKGGAVVTMDSVHYEQMIYKQLKDKII